MFQQARAHCVAAAPRACSAWWGACAAWLRAGDARLAASARLRATTDTFSLSPLQRKPSVTKEWQQKLPDFVRRLEEALYRSAFSKARGAAAAAAPAPHWAPACALARLGGRRALRCVSPFQNKH